MKKVQILLMLFIPLFMSHLQAQYTKLGVMYCPMKIQGDYARDFDHKYNFSVFPYIGEVKSFRFLSHNFSFLIILSK